MVTRGKFASTLPSQMVTEFLSKKIIPLVTIVTIGNGMMVRELYLCSEVRKNSNEFSPMRGDGNKRNFNSKDSNSFVPQNKGRVL
jgi:hypothetical protein